MQQLRERKRITRTKAIERITLYLQDNPGSAGKDIADAVGISKSLAFVLLNENFTKGERDGLSFPWYVKGEAPGCEVVDDANKPWWAFV